MEDPDIADPDGAALFAWVQSHSHGHPVVSRCCPGCSEDVSTVGIVYLAYTYEVCACEFKPDFRHLIERIWHSRCLVDAGPEADELLDVLAKINNLPGTGRHVYAARALAGEALSLRRGVSL